MSKINRVSDNESESFNEEIPRHLQTITAKFTNSDSKSLNSYLWTELIILLGNDYAIHIKIGDVAEYGSKSDLQLFLEKFETFCSLKAQWFPKIQYQRKIQYVTTRLVSGPVQRWIVNKCKVDGSGEAGTIWGSYEEFLAQLKLYFDNPNRLEEARDSLDTLIQGDEKTAAFLAQFRAVQVEARFIVSQLL